MIEKKGLYILKSECRVKNTLEGPGKLVVGVTVKDIILCNRRFGHLSAQVLRSLDLLTHNKDIESFNNCHVYPLAK